MGVRNRRRMHSTRDQSGKMRHVDEIQRTNLVGNLPHAREINDPRIRAAPSYDQLRSLFFGELLEFVVVDGLGFFGDSVRNDLVGFSGEIQVMTVGQVSAMRQVEA